MTGALTKPGEMAFRGLRLGHATMGPKSLLAATPIRGLCALACMLLASLLAAVLAVPGAVRAAETTTVGATTVLVEDLSVVKSEDMDFGNIIVAAGGGTIVMNPTVTPTCAVTGGLVHSGACQPAEFVGAGRFNRLVRVRIPPSGRMTVTNATGATMRIDQMDINGTPDTLVVRENVRSFRFRILNPSGLFYFRVGGRLNVGASQAVGTYTGTFDIDVQYF